MKGFHHKFKYVTAVALVISILACEKEYLYETPPPDTSQQTSTLEATLVTTAPATINAPYWKTADYLKVSATNVSVQQLYGDGLLNMTGTYSGLNSFSKGADPELSLKAAYDNEYLYILAEWVDSTVNASNSSWLYNGPLDPNKSDTTGGWTSQRNCDKLAFAFEVAAASSSAGNFSTVGCAAACHTSIGVPVMHPSSGKVDLWNWSLARSYPLGYAQDMVANSDSLADDSGQKMYERNTAGSTNRSGPAYEWDGTTQSVTQPSGSTGILDPAFFLLNKTPFTGDAEKGDSIFHSPAPPGDCASCHGVNGVSGSASALNLISMNKKSRSVLSSSMDNVPDMAPYWGPLTATERNDLIAYLRGLSGVPGYFLVAPSGSNADIETVTNITPVQIVNAFQAGTNKHSKYQVLIKRKLKTNNSDDIQFDPVSQKTYLFGVALMDNDGKNHIGSTKETLTFK